MAYMSQPNGETPAGENFIRVLVRGLGTNQIELLTIHCSNGHSYNASVLGGSTNNYYSTTQTFTGLQADRGYSFWATGRTYGQTAINVPSEIFYTTRPSNIFPDAPSVSVNVNGQSVIVTVTARYGTQRISSSLGNNSKDAYIGNGETTYFYYTVSEWNTSYDLYVYAYSSTGHSNYTYRSVQIGSAPAIYPTTPDISVTVSGKSVTVTVTARSNTSKVRVSLGDNTKPDTSLTSGSTQHFYFTVGKFDTSYDCYVYAISTTGHMSSPAYRLVKSGADDIPPVIYNRGSNGNNAITVNWSASDADVGLRDSNAFYVYIGTESGGVNSLVHKATLDKYATTYTFQQDANGNILKTGKRYPVRVRAFDKNANQAYYDDNVTLIRRKPASHSWTYPKVQGGDFNLTASEWNYLLTRINEFREYSSLAHINTFTSAIRGGTFTANQFNQAVNTINTMPITSSAPQLRSSGDDITANVMNTLSSSLNSIN